MRLKIITLSILSALIYGLSFNAYAVNLPQASSYVGYSGIASGVTSADGNAAPVIPFGAVTTTPLQIIGGGFSSTTAGFYYNLYADDSKPFQVLGGTYYATDVWILTSTASDALLLGEGTIAASEASSGKPPGWRSKFTAASSAASNSVFKGSLTGNQWNHFSFPGITFSPNSFPSFQTAGSGGEFKVLISGFIK